MSSMILVCESVRMGCKRGRERKEREGEGGEEDEQQD